MVATRPQERVDIIPPTGYVRLRLWPTPFVDHVIERRMPVGTTILGMLVPTVPHAALLSHLDVYVGDWRVPPSMWSGTRPKSGVEVVVRVNVQNGGGGGGGKSPMRMVMSLAVMVAAAYLGPALLYSEAMIGTTTAMAAGLTDIGLSVGTSLMVLEGATIGAMSLAANLALNAVIPPGGSSARDGWNNSFDGSPVSTPTQMITGTANRMNPWGKIPQVLGRNRIFPPLASRWVTESHDGKNYFRQVMMVYGPVQLSDFRIGETAIEAFDGVEMEIRQGYPGEAPLTLFPDTIRQDTMQVQLTSAGGWIRRTTRPNCSEISIDATCPRGLAHFVSGGTSEATEVQIEVRYAPSGSDAWVSPTWLDSGEHLLAGGVITLKDNTTSATIRSGRWAVADGRYDVEMRRITVEPNDKSYLNETWWTALRSIQAKDPIIGDGWAKIVVRILASGQLQGQLAELNCLAMSIAPDWDEATGTWITRPTNNCASMMRLVLQGKAARTKAPDEQIDLEALQAWAESTHALGLSFNTVIDREVRKGDLLKEICSAGRARLVLKGDQISVLHDVPQSQYQQVFSPDNSWGYTGSIKYAKKPHGLRCRWINPDLGYQEDLLVVYADGFNEANATRFETMEFLSYQDREAVKTMASYHLKVNAGRPDQHKWYCELEGLRSARGDLVSFSHYSIDVALGGGYIDQRTIDPDTQRITDIRIDTDVIMETGKTYALRVQLSNFAVTDLAVETDPGTTRTLRLVVPIPEAQGAQVGDLAVFGEAQRLGLDLIIKDIDPGPQMTFRITGVPAAPSVFQPGTSPPFDPGASTRPRSAVNPTAPVVAAVRSDESVGLPLAGGAWRSRIVIDLGAQPGDTPTSAFGSCYRRTGGADWTYQPTYPAEGGQVIIEGVVDGQAYDIEVWAISPLWRISERRRISGYTVIGRTTPPPSPTELYVEMLPGGARRYRPVGPIAADHVGWLYRWNPGINTQWDGAAAAYPGIETSGRMEAAAVIARTFTMLVKAVDQIGLESPEAAFAVVQLGDLVTDRLVDQRDFAALGWPGTITGGAISDGEVVADPAEAMFTNPALPMFSDPAEPMVSSFSALVYQGAFQVARRGYLSLDWNVGGQGSTIELRRPGTAPMFTDPFSPMFADPTLAMMPDPAWMAYLGAFGVAKDDPVEIRVTVAGGTSAGRIAALVASVDVPVESETIDDLVVPVGGIRLPVTRTYEEVVRVGLTVQGGQGYTAVRAEPLDKSTAGPLVKCYDAAGVAVAGLVDAEVQGVLLQ